MNGNILNEAVELVMKSKATQALPILNEAIARCREELAILKIDQEKIQQAHHSVKDCISEIVQLNVEWYKNKRGTLPPPSI